MSEAPTIVYRVGDVEIDVTRSCVHREGHEYYLRPQALEVLLYLIARRDRLVSKDELLRSVWSDAAVTENTLVQCVGDVRRALGDDARRSRMVKTIHKYGYEFVGPVAAGPFSAPEPQSSANLDDPRPRSGLLARRPGWLAVGAAALMVAMASLIVGWLWSDAGPKVTRLAVGRFENRTGNPDFDWLQDGLPGMLVTGVAGAGPFEVSSQRDVRSLERAQAEARHARADVLLLGSYATLGRQLRVDVHAHDVASGRLIAAERLLADEGGQLLTHVDMLSTKLAGHLWPRVERPGPGVGFTETGR
jgi:DNA-binding winged helix-turn-helix (wHTH) protein/TolB-like protein